MRTLSREARHERRVQVIRLRKAGLTYDAIATQAGLTRTGVFGICKRYAASGAKAQLVKLASSHLRRVQKQPARIRSCFQHDPVQYAA